MSKEIILCLTLAGCGNPFGFILPDSRTPAERALEVEPKCRGATETVVATVLAPSAVEHVEPENAFVQSGNDRRANLSGARIYLVPAAGQSPEAITRSLECHQVRATLGQVEVRADDPYVLPGRWVHIDTHSEGDGFSVRITIDSISDAKRILARAQLHVAPRQAQ
jgi:hypothetical protein